MHLVVADIGGTKVDVAIARVASTTRRHRGVTLVWRERVLVAEVTGFDAVLQKAFQALRTTVKAPCDGLAIGGAGPVIQGELRVTNLSWQMDAASLSASFHCPTIVLNDLEAQGWGLSDVGSEGVFDVQRGLSRTGNRALIAAGTGLGEAILVQAGDSHVPFATEGAHADFGPGTPRDRQFLEWLEKRHPEFGHVSWERCVSGSLGLPLLVAFSAEAWNASDREGWEKHLAASRKEVGPALIEAAQSGHAGAREVLTWFTELYGAESGNLALKAMALAGVYVAGGLTEAVRSVLGVQEFAAAFLTGFCRKGRFAKFLSEIPVRLVFDRDLALKGAAHAFLGSRRGL